MVPGGVEGRRALLPISAALTQRALGFRTDLRHSRSTLKSNR